MPAEKNHIGGTVIYKLLEGGAGVLGLVQSYFICIVLEWEIIVGEIKHFVNLVILWPSTNHKTIQWRS